MVNRPTLTVLVLSLGLLMSSKSNSQRQICGPEPVEIQIENMFIACGFAPARQNPTVPTYPYGPYGGSLRFEENRGQASAAYPYLGKGNGFFLYLNSQETVIDFRPANRVVHLRLTGAHAGAPLLKPAGQVSYLLGADPQRWLRGVPTYEEMGYHEVYPGIDLVYYEREGTLEHDFRLAPGADAAQIRWHLSGLDRLTMEGDSLLLEAGEARMRWDPPMAWQAGRRVAARYRLHADGTVGFDLAAYDRTQPLTIDPVMNYLSYLGNRGGEVAGRSAVDAQGNIYVVGATSDPSYPVTPGAVIPTGTGFNPSNIVISKLDPTGTRLLYSTYLGGGEGDFAAGVAVDAQGAIYVTGATGSNDFPVTQNAFQRRVATVPTGRTDPGNCFVAKLNATGSTLVYSTFLSGSERDGCTAIAVDTAGSAYVTGATESTDLPTTPDVVQGRYRLGSGTPRYDVLVAKLSPDGSALAYSTLFGGTGTETGHSIAVDSAGNTYITGATNSTNFPVSTGAYRTTYGGQGGTPQLVPLGDAFLFKLNPGGTQVIYSTYLGGTRDDVGFAVAVDAAGSAYVAGNTLSRDFPVTAGAYQREWKGEGGQAYLPAGDAFVVKFNASGSALAYSTLLGGGRDDRAISLALAPDGSVHVVGHSLSVDFPVSADATQTRNRSTNTTDTFAAGDGFYTHLDPTGARILFSTYLGGSSNDWLSGVSRLPSGDVVITGTTGSPDLNVTANALQRTYFGASERLRPTGDLLLARFGSAPAVAFANAASYATGAVAPRLITMLVGTGFTATTRFVFDGAAAEVLYVTPTQAAVVVPAGVRNPTSLVVDGGPPTLIPVVPAQPALFTANASGTGPGAILNQDGALNTAANPAAAGEIVVLYGTGQGASDSGIEATIAGRPAEVLYAGPSPGLTLGLVQVNVRVPVGVPPGPQPVLIRAGGAVSQSGVTVAIRP
jgi:uncharacterized protein (TIGR03437 family)